MQAVGIPSEGALEKAKYFASFCDYLILDSMTPSMTSIGVAGVTHDWNMDKEIIELGLATAFERNPDLMWNID
jgi:phosphoribosylanthranilate isomerase